MCQSCWLPRSKSKTRTQWRDSLGKVGVIVEGEWGGVQEREAGKATTALLHLLQLSPVGETEDHALP